MKLLRNLKLVDDSGRLRRAGALLLTTPPDDVEASLVYVQRQRASAEPDYSTDAGLQRREDSYSGRILAWLWRSGP